MHPRRSTLLGAMVAGLLTLTVLPASATDGSGAEGTAPDQPVEQDAARHSSSLREAATTAPPAGSGAYFTVDEHTRPVAPGLELTSFDRYDARGWIRVDALTADLSTPGLKLDYASPGKVSSTAPLTEALGRDNAVAGVNADFFDISDTGAPQGVGVDRQRGLLHAPAADWNHTFSLDRDNVATIARTFLEAQILPRGRRPIPVTNLNSPTLAEDGIGIYTWRWGSDARSRVLPGPGATRAVVIRRGKVRANRKHLQAGGIPRGTTVLVGTGAGARKLRGLHVGRRVAVEYALSRDARVAVGGSDFLIRNRKLVAPSDPAMHPRTAIGIDKDQGKIIIVTVDGRQSTSRGLTLRETGVLMRRLGAEDALNLDGGGSSTMLARESGEPVTVVNQPSDGHLRSVPEGLGFTVAAGSGRLRGIRIEPAADLPDSDRVLTGLSRVLVARGHDETYDPVRARPRWEGSNGLSAPGGRRARVVVTGTKAGTGTVTASARGVHGEYQLRVLGRVHRLETNVPSIALSGRGSRGTFDVRGYDARGFGTWVAPRDVRLGYDHEKLQVRRTGRGFTVTALAGSASDAIRVRAGGRTTYVGVTVGLARKLADRMNTLSGWTASANPRRADASLQLIAPRRGRAGKAIGLRYTLRGKGTRAAYLTATPQVRLPRKARRIGLWVRGDGNDAWLRLVVEDAGGARSTLNLARRVSWKGWRFVATALPGDLAQPVRFARVYAVQTKKKRRYSGTLGFDDLTVFTERTPTVPSTRLLRDPLVADRAPSPAGGLRVAVLSDAELSGTARGNAAADRTRRTLRDIAASQPDLVLINGDLVGRARPTDFAFAARLLDRELGGIPWRYLPGDDELDHGSLAGFRDRFGTPVDTFDRTGTRFVLLNSAPGTLRLGGFGQLVRLRRALRTAETDESISSVVVVAHHPTSDPDAGGNAELADPREGGLVEDLLAGFRADSGKDVAYVGSHARRFALTRTDDVPHVLAGPVNDAARGGTGRFTGWSLLRIGTGSGPWLSAEFRPVVDSLRVHAPRLLAVGTGADASATVVQAGRRVSVGYPMRVEWVGSRTMYVGRPGAAPRSAVAAYNPRTGRLTALRAGQTQLVVTVNGVSAAKDLTVS